MAYASVEDQDMLGYDSIVNELNREVQAPTSLRSRGGSTVPVSDPFDNILIHGGVGFAHTMQTLDLGPNGGRTYFNQRGFQATLGIDLFSENWMAEGSARSFGESGESSTRISLKEFELKILYKNMLSQKLGFRVGGGLSARYMTIRQDSASTTEQPIGQTIETTTPSSVATLGLDMFLSKGFSLGLDLSTRNTMIAETLDRDSYDATFRVDTHF